MDNNVYYFELSNKDHHKFYEIGIQEKTIKISYGRIGSSGKRVMINFATNKELLKFFEKQIMTKMKKGYQISPKGITPPRRKGINPGQLCFPFLIAMQS